MRFLRAITANRSSCQPKRRYRSVTPGMPTRGPNARAAALVVMLAAGSMACAAPAPDFGREIRPLLEKHCFQCHGPDKQKSGLRFDTKEGAFKTGESGEKAIVPGHASQSLLIRLVSSKDESERMPPKGEPLSTTQIDLLKHWIDAGAVWVEAGGSTRLTPRAEMVVTEEDRKHWSYLPLTKPPVPSVKHAALVRSPVDRFVLARLEEKNLVLSSMADGRKLARRIYIDLIGLP